MNALNSLIPQIISDNTALSWICEKKSTCRLFFTDIPFGKYDEGGFFSPSEFKSRKIGAEIGNITIINDEVTCVNSNGKKEFFMKNTRAIVIAIGNRYLHLEKSNYWSELWSVRIRLCYEEVLLFGIQ